MSFHASERLGLRRQRLPGGPTHTPLPFGCATHDWPAPHENFRRWKLNRASFGFLVLRAIVTGPRT